METEKKIRIKKFFYGIIAFIIMLNLVLTEKNSLFEQIRNEKELKFVELTRNGSTQQENETEKLQYLYQNQF